MTKQIKSGEVVINVHATGIIMQVFVKILEEINQNLILACSEEGKISTITTKKFIVSIHNLRLVECQIFAAFVAPIDELFWQDQNNEEI